MAILFCMKFIAAFIDVSYSGVSGFPPHFVTYFFLKDSTPAFSGNSTGNHNYIGTKC